MKKAVFFVMGILVIGFVAISVFRPSAEKKSERTKRAVAIEVANSQVADLSARYSATSEWKKLFDDFEKKVAGGVRPIYTVDVEEVLLTGEPVLITGEIVDVKRLGAKGEYEIHLGSEFGDLLFILTCDKRKAEKILGQATGGRGSFAVVATLNSVSRSGLELMALNEEDSASMDVSAGIVSPFIVRGTCLDLEYIANT